MSETKKMGTGKKFAIGCGGLIVLFGVIGAIVEDKKGTSTKAPEAAVSTGPNASSPEVKDAVIDPKTGKIALALAPDLYQLYKQNEIDADNQLKGKIIKVRGVVESISKDAFDNAYLTIHTGSLLGLRADFDDKHKPELATLRAGQKVTIQGRVEGFIMDCVQVKDCQLVQ